MRTRGLTDLDELILRCRHGKARSYISEAVACVKVGAFRASIVLTWVAVVHDLIGKFEELELGGDRNARVKLEQFRKIISENVIKGSLEYERTILEAARDEFEFIGALAYDDLARLRDDRHRCAHPSMLNLDADYQPSPELARYHLVNAVAHLLEHGPAQGKAALGRLLGELEQDYYPKSIEEMRVHLEHGPLGRPRDSLVRNFLLLLMKNYMEEQQPVSSENGFESFRTRARRKLIDRRVVITLAAVFQMHREVALDALSGSADSLVGRAPPGRLGALLRLLGEVGELWMMMSPARAGQIKRYVEKMPVADVADGALRAAWSLKELQDAVRIRLSSAEVWEALSFNLDTPREWIEVAVQYLSVSSDWNSANKRARLLVRNVDSITVEHARQIVESIRENDELKSAFGVGDLLAALASSPEVGAGTLKQLVEKAGLGEVYKEAEWWADDPASRSESGQEAMDGK